MPYDRERWRAAVREWYLKHPPEDCGYVTTRDPEDLYERADYPQLPADAVHWRRCKGCEGEFVATTSQVMSHPDPEDPRLVCSSCRSAQHLELENNVDSHFNSGSRYYSGRGMGQDYEEAAKCFHKAAFRGHAMAQFRLGQLYGNGEGVAQDFVEAYVWCSFATAQGIKEAYEYIQLISAKMTPEQLAAARLRAAK